MVRKVESSALPRSSSDGLLLHRSERGELGLRQPATPPHDPKDSARAQRFHTASIDHADWQRLTSGL
jgi:hypothetical protein